MNNPTIDGIEDEHLQMGMAAVAAALESARVEIQGYRRDAERYRWLRAEVVMPVTGYETSQLMNMALRSWAVALHTYTLDAAIDAAIIENIQEKP